MGEFSFPYAPYEIQLKLMREIEQCINQKQIGIFESPTGTGKSLSVICATMTWLEEYERKHESDLIDRCEANKENIPPQDDWIAEYKHKRSMLQDADEARTEMDKLNSIRRKIDRAVHRNSETRKRKGIRDVEPVVDADDEFVPQDEYCSDTEVESGPPDDDLKSVKIYYASRTHSQLEQLVDELGKTRFKPRIVTAGSRSALCANESVKNLKRGHLINERCMELRKNGTGSKKTKNEEGKSCSTKMSCGCGYYSADAIEDLSNEILACRLTKTSDVLKTGEANGACPYYSVRKALPLAQLVLLPYQVLFHDSTRAAWGIDLKDCVVVLDEAHNVLQTIGSLYSCELSDSSISLALKLVRQYIDRYSSRLKERNLYYVNLLCSLLVSLEKIMSGVTPQNGSTEEVCTIQKFIAKYDIPLINFFKLVKFMDATDMCKKFHGFFIRENATQVKVQKVVPKSGITKLLNKKKDASASTTEESASKMDASEPRPVPSPMFLVKTFIESLNNRCEDGRIIVDKKNKRLRFVLLNPADRLADVVRQARSTILVGGTMEPAKLLIDCLERGTSIPIRRFSCEHVIEDNQLLALSIGKLENDKPISLTYQTRSDDTMLKSIAVSLVELSSTVPNGCVAFFPSYDFLNQFIKKLHEFNLFEKLSACKVVYVEPHGANSTETWDKFVTSARTKRGAILFAVVGGKLSEGINFSDDLGRAVFMIGLPFPNKNSVELQEKMKFLDGKMTNGGKMLYSSLCMHSVNQSVGRAIRHRSDYAAVFLLDQRYSDPAIRSQLSGWISRRVQDATSLSDALMLSKKFFADMV